MDAEEAIRLITQADADSFSHDEFSVRTQIILREYWNGK